MKQLFYLSAICMLVLSACTGSFKKSDNGLEYKIISNGSGKSISYGNFMQIHIKQVYSGTKDSVLMDTRRDEIMPRIQILDSVKTYLALFKILAKMKKGDSVVIRQLTDTAFKNSPKGMPPFMQKGKYMYIYLTMVNFFETENQADSANKAEFELAKPKIYKKQIEEIEKDLAGKKAQIDIEGKLIEAYLAKNNIKAQKTKWGTYVAVLTEGTGEKISNQNIAMVNYTGRTLDSGRVFDSNTDPKFKHVEPYPVNLGDWTEVIIGWKDALLQLKKGSKAIVFIPSSLAYGESGKGVEIKPNLPIMFDMEIIDVTTEEEFMAKQKAMQEEMMKKMQESQNQAPANPKKPGN